MRTRLLVFLFCSFPVVATAIAGQESLSAEQSFDRGVEAARAGEDPLARSHFIDARENGLDSSALHYNLGVVLYRMGRYVEAEESFSVLLEREGWTALAHYNLGLLAEQRNQPELALDHYAAAEAGADDANLHDLAGSARRRLGAVSSLTRGVVSLGLGHDSNPALVSSDDLAEDGEIFLELWAHLEHLPGTRPWLLSGEIYLLRHTGLSDFDFTGLRGAGLREYDWRQWSFGAGPAVGVFSLGGAHYQNRYELEARARRPEFAGGILRLRAELARIAPASEYESLRGSQLRARGRWDTGFGRYRAMLGYRFETNNRRDLDADDEPRNFSPDRHRLRASVGRPVGSQARVDAELLYEKSRYGSVNNTEPRRDRRSELRLIAGRGLAPDWQAHLEYRYSRKRSNRERFASRQHIVQLTIEYSGLSFRRSP